MRQLGLFVLGWSLAGLPMLWLLLAEGYEQSFLILNRLHTPALDAVMPHLTHAGDGLLLGSLVGLRLIRREPGRAWNLLLVMLLVAALVRVLKFEVFPEWSRPIRVFEDREAVHWISLGRERMYTFPSGHSTAAVAALALLAAALRPGWALLCGLLAGVLGYTRVYLGVHFPGDVLAGALLGFGLALAGLQWCRPWLRRRAAARPPQALRRQEIFLYLLGTACLLASFANLYCTYYMPAS